MLILDGAMEAFRRQRVHRRATLWQIDRLDGTTLRFTDHPFRLTYDGEDYEPASGAEASARQMQEGLKSQNLEVRGFVDSAAITQEDIEAGVYEDAMVTERLVDWRYPWAGYFRERIYWLQDMGYNDIGFVASMVGVEGWLKAQTGEVITRDCSNDLGDDVCRVDLSAITVSGTVSAVTNDRYDFETDLVGADDYFTFGWLRWLTGDNVNAGRLNPVTSTFGFEVRSFLNSNGATKLFLFTPYPIQIGDTFSIYPGCDKLYVTCQTKFDDPDTMTTDNTANFRGFRHMPGVDRQTKTPEAKSG